MSCCQAHWLELVTRMCNSTTRANLTDIKNVMTGLFWFLDPTDALRKKWIQRLRRCFQDDLESLQIGLSLGEAAARRYHVLQCWMAVVKAQTPPTHVLLHHITMSRSRSRPPPLRAIVNMVRDEDNFAASIQVELLPNQVRVMSRKGKIVRHMTLFSLSTGVDLMAFETAEEYFVNDSDLPCIFRIFQTAK